MSKPFAVNETEICIRGPHSKDDLVEPAERRRHRACVRKAPGFDTVTAMAPHLRVATTAKILSSSRDAIVEISTAASMTFEIPFH
ncbi:hypothetical protein H8A95_13325 [Bradyrhizobium sp. Pear76]|uniref:hypothetical protein n=1 Tax=Bradyrhizobium oropedii TaxID=1571201 RepID=UPI001E29EBE8|nr:hypothetical protein [Bradyrhizobium oropedii]MCC8963265.1 hypothetical protein [Bradyrhizobium oropedii]